MSKSLTNPLQSIIATAAKKLPQKTGATAHFQDRLNATGPIVILADTSGSMAFLAWGGKRKIQILREAIGNILRPEHRLISFSSIAAEVRTIPEPGGNTALHDALALVRSMRPSYTLVISDGQPDDSETAIEHAKQLSGVLDVLYIGPDSDRAAIDFMIRLSRAGCGRMRSADMEITSPTMLASHVTALLPAR